MIEDEIRPYVDEIRRNKKPVKSEDLFIDIGAATNEDAQKMVVMAGTQITSDTEFRSLDCDMVTGKALDDRGSCAVLIEAMRQMKDVKATVHAVQMLLLYQK